MKFLVRFFSVYLGWRILLFSLAFLALLLIPIRSGYLPDVSFGSEKIPQVFRVWGNMDGVVFMLIARRGYSAAELPFFPLFPLSIRWLHHSTGLSYIFSGLIISSLAFLGALSLCRKLLNKDGQLSLWPLFLALILFFPTAFYYSAIYNDALFFLFACATLWFGRKQQWFLASLCGGLAALTRLTGLSLFFYLGAEYLIQLQPSLEKRWHIPTILRALVESFHPKNIWKQKAFFFFLIPGAFLSYLAYIHSAFGDWNLFFKGVEVWHRSELTFPLQTFWRYFKILVIHANFTFVYLVALGEAAFTLLYGALLVWSWQKIRFSYWVFWITALTIPVITGTLQGMPRYGLHIFPFFLAFTLWLSRRSVFTKALVFLLSFVLLVVYLFAFTRGYFVT